MRIFQLALLLLTSLLFAPIYAFDSDDDNIPNKYDLCPKEAEDIDNFEDQDGCPDPDNDKDGVCDPLVSEKGWSAKFAGVCRGSDKCVEVSEDKDGFEDEDGCPDPDNDKDGIPDTKDKCSSEPEDRDGFEDNDGCPEPDNDKDGVCDVWVSEKNMSSKYSSLCQGTDNCSDAVEDKDSFEDEDGCPEADNDKDGMKDEVDKCPLEPETMNGVDDADGCPDKALPPFLALQNYPLVRFRPSTAELTVEAEPVLEQIAKQLKEYPEKQVEIHLFTSYKGKKKEDYLAQLQARSKTLVEFLVGHGALPEQLKELSYTLENFEAFKGTEQDFSQEKPMELKLLN